MNREEVSNIVLSLTLGCIILERRQEILDDMVRAYKTDYKNTLEDNNG